MFGGPWGSLEGHRTSLEVLGIARGAFRGPLEGVAWVALMEPLGNLEKTSNIMSVALFSPFGISWEGPSGVVFSCFQVPIVFTSLFLCPIVLSIFPTVFATILHTAKLFRKLSETSPTLGLRHAAELPSPVHCAIQASGWNC